MSTPNAAAFTGNIPKNYDTILGPVVFVPYAEDMAARAKALAPTNVLELAAGTGIVTRALRKALPPTTAILATDLNGAMLDIARPHFSDGDNVRFEVVDAMELPQGDESHDMILSQFGVMFLPDKVASYKEAFRVLKPGGTYLLNVWDSWTANPWAELFHNAIAQFFEGETPGFYRVPFHYSDEGTIRRELEAAGFVNVTVERMAKTGHVPSTDDLAYAAVFGNPIADEIRAMETDLTPEQAVEAVKAALVEQFGSSPTTMPICALVVSAEKPSPKKKGLLSRFFG